MITTRIPDVANDRGTYIKDNAVALLFEECRLPRLFSILHLGALGCDG